jgi:hypothetical protein
MLTYFSVDGGVVKDPRNKDSKMRKQVFHGKIITGKDFDVNIQGKLYHKGRGEGVVKVTIMEKRKGKKGVINEKSLVGKLIIKLNKDNIATETTIKDIESSGKCVTRYNPTGGKNDVNRFRADEKAKLSLDTHKINPLPGKFIF